MQEEASNQLLELLKPHKKAGRIDEKSYQRIRNFELGIVDETKEESTPRDRSILVDLSLGVGAIIGTILLISGVALISDGAWIAFALLTAVAIGLYRVELEDMAGVFLRETSVMIFASGATLAVFMFYDDRDWLNAVVGPAGIVNWLPLIIVSAVTYHLTRSSNIEVVVSQSIAALSLPFTFAMAIGLSNATASFLGIAVIRLILTADQMIGCYDNEKRISIFMQRLITGGFIGGFAWAALNLFGNMVLEIREGDRYIWDSVQDERAMAFIGLLAIVVWMIIVDFNSRTRKPVTYNHNLDKGWIFASTYLIFFAWLPLNFAFNVVGGWQIEDLVIGEYEMSLAWPIACIVNAMIVISLARGIPSLDSKRDVTPSKFATIVTASILTFIWFVIGISDFLGDDAMLVLIPLGLAVLGGGTWKLVSHSQQAVSEEE